LGRQGSGALGIRSVLADLKGILQIVRESAFERAEVPI